MRLKGISIPFLIDPTLDMSKVDVIGTMHQCDHGWIKRYYFMLKITNYYYNLLFSGVKVILSTKRDVSNFPLNVRLLKEERKTALKRILCINASLPSSLRVNFQFSKKNLSDVKLKGRN
jgi:hypothetical protein